MSNNKKDMQAEKIIDKMGGIRPLAKRLGLSASTVQGWKQRKTIPEARLKDILATAEEDNIDIYSVFENNNDSSEQVETKDSTDGFDSKAIAISAEEERRESNDRRAGRDRRKGRDENYKGEERRTGVSRRSGLDRRVIREKRRKKVVMQQKFAFVERMVMSAAVIYMIGTLAFMFIMGPEYHDAMQKARQIDTLEKQLLSMGYKLSDLQKKQISQNSSFAGRLNKRIEELDRKTAEIGRKFDAVGTLGGMAVQGRISKLESKVTSLSGLLGKIDVLNSVGIGGETFSIPEIQSVISGLRNDVSRIDGDVDKARNENTVVAQIVQDVSKQDLGAAAMLLALGQFRENVNSEKPFSEDLQIIQDLVGNNDELQAALKKFAPYAESGVLSTARLQGEFGRMAADIIEAGLSGDNISLNDQITKHVGNLVTITKDGRPVLSPENMVTDVVNKAHEQIVKGDIGAAVKTLRTLEGPASKEAKKWIHLAKGSLMAKKTNNAISRDLLARISSGRQLSVDSLEKFLNRNFIKPLGLSKPEGMSLKWDPTKNRKDKMTIEY